MKNIRLFNDFKINENVILPGEYLDFVDMLKDHGVDTDLYGTCTYKTLGHLFQEMKEGETELTIENGKLVRRVQFVGARILYKKNGEWLRLFEEKQIFKDGRERRRTNMPYSAAEKFKSGEDPKEVIVRGMKEELNINISTDQFTFYNRKEISENSDYPGITSFHIGYEFLVVLNENQYIEEGYIEKQKDKDVYFVWRPVSIKESTSYSENMIYSWERFNESYNKPRVGGKKRWSVKYKKSIDCNNPKGFSQKQYCKRKKSGGKYH